MQIITEKIDKIIDDFRKGNIEAVKQEIESANKTLVEKYILIGAILHKLQIKERRKFINAISSIVPPNVSKSAYLLFIGGYEAIINQLVSLTNNIEVVATIYKYFLKHKSLKYNSQRIYDAQKEDAVLVVSKLKELIDSYHKIQTDKNFVSYVKVQLFPREKQEIVSKESWQLVFENGIALKDGQQIDDKELVQTLKQFLKSVAKQDSNNFIVNFNLVNYKDKKKINVQFFLFD